MSLGVQVELTIAWNHIYSLQGLATVGQLIPLVLGVRGVVKVLWNKWCFMRDGIRGDEEFEVHLSKYEKDMKKYLEWKRQEKLEREGPPVSNLQKRLV